MLLAVSAWNELKQLKQSIKLACVIPQKGAMSSEILPLSFSCLHV